ncbi:DUF6082 family protein [Streptomyces sp. SDT5-1]|uniref:DUF6082 family protein n=1 Tax=Streptomyces sp. SDT5-1 TaxID=3406418 RepID=UPI003FD22379
MAYAAAGVQAAGVLLAVYRVHVALRRMEERAAEETRRRAFTEYRRDHQRLVARATEDPTLLPVLDAYEDDLPPEFQRRHLYANELYQHALHGYHVGLLSLTELHGHLRYIFQSRSMRDYWEVTRHHRASLPEDSDEARLGRVVDALVADLDANDDAEDGESWWVVGTPPNE